MRLALSDAEDLKLRHREMLRAVRTMPILRCVVKAEGGSFINPRVGKLFERNEGCHNEPTNQIILEGTMDSINEQLKSFESSAQKLSICMQLIDSENAPLSYDQSYLNQPPSTINEFWPFGEVRNEFDLWRLKCRFSTLLTHVPEAYILQDAYPVLFQQWLHAGLVREDCARSNSLLEVLEVLHRFRDDLREIFLLIGSQNCELSGITMNRLMQFLRRVGVFPEGANGYKILRETMVDVMYCANHPLVKEVNDDTVTSLDWSSPQCALNLPEFICFVTQWAVRHQTELSINLPVADRLYKMLIHNFLHAPQLNIGITALGIAQHEMIQRLMGEAVLVELEELWHERPLRPKDDDGCIFQNKFKNQNEQKSV